MSKLISVNQLKSAILIPVVVSFIFISGVKSQANDSLKLAQSFINLNLTVNYFDSLAPQRLSKIIPFIENELNSITNRIFIEENHTLVDLSYSYLHFLKARLEVQTKTEINRDFLLNVKNRISRSVQHLNRVNIESNLNHQGKNTFYDLIGVDSESVYIIRQAINLFKTELNPYFNKDIYPDFQRLFLAAKNTNKFYFDSLSYFAGLYNMEVDFYILKNSKRHRRIRFYPENYVYEGPQYELDVALDLIAKYMQLSYIALLDLPVKDKYELYLSYDWFTYVLNPSDSLNFRGYQIMSDIPKDTFFWEELNERVVMILHERLKHKFIYKVEQVEGPNI